MVPRPVADPVTTSAPGALWTPVKVGAYELAHRVVMAPLTRCRAIGSIPQPSAIQYYSDRATEGGLIISEGTCIAPLAYGYPNTPGIFKPEHVAAWQPIVQSVHDKGGVFFLQLWHVGRASHPAFLDGAQPISSSTIAVIGDKCYVPWLSPPVVDYPVPRALPQEEISEVVQQFAQGALNSIEAGFDGVEIHGANGYLVDQFLKDGANTRTDEYGGSIENRCRFALEVVDAVVAAVGADRTGIRFSPFGGFLDGNDSDPYALYAYLMQQLDSRGLAYVHFVEPRVGGNDDRPETKHSIEPFRKAYSGVVLSAGGYTGDNGEAAIASGHADAVVYGRYFVSNPDLVKRLQLHAPLNKYDRATFYTPDEPGYNDYPTLEEVEASASA